MAGDPRDVGDSSGTPRVLIVSEHASVKFGGEAILPWHYFRLLRRRGVEAWLVVHDRTRDELLSLLPEEAGRIHFIRDTGFHKFAARVGRRLPDRLSYFTIGYASRISTQWAARATARRLIAEQAIDVVHQPIPVSPRETTLMHGLGVPVVLGPMNGNMAYPPAFARRGKSFIAASRGLSNLLHRAMPGKLRAETLLVANQRTREALPIGVRGEVIDLVENGVDLDLWQAVDRSQPRQEPIRFVFLGRLIALKAVDVLLDALARMPADLAARLDIVGDGPMRAAWEAQTQQLGLTDRVRFLGWQTQAECARILRKADALLLASLHECGGAVVLEAMASAIPVIATDWGGPSDYVDASCGFLIAPDSRESLVEGFRAAMTRLAVEPDLARQLGLAGRKRVEDCFDWESKIDTILSIYRSAIASDKNQNQ